ncbi:MAG: ribosomal protein S18-alanine N-acetyltransferase [Methylocella sp.]
MSPSRHVQSVRKGAPPSNRRIGPERSAECAAIHKVSFAYPWDESDFEQLLLAPEIVAAGAVDARDCSLAGFILSRVALDEAEILTIAVALERRRCGVGKILMTPHLTGLAAIGVKRLFLEVDAENAAARALYARYGFETVAERKAYYRKLDARQASALVMRLDLQEWV